MQTRPCRIAVIPADFAAFSQRCVPRRDDPENAEFLRALLLLGGALFMLTLLAYLCTTNWTWPFPRDKATLVLGRDFLNLWMYGRALLDADPARFYDIVDLQCRTGKTAGPRLSRPELAEPADRAGGDGAVRLLAYFPALFAWFAVSLLAVLSRRPPRGCRLRACSRWCWYRRPHCFA